MSKIVKVIFSLLVCYVFNGFALESTTVTATNGQIADQLDLNAVASVFGKSKDLADFEMQLNSPDKKISNLDLNNDGKVDYLRVVENVDRNLHVVTIQSVLGDNYYQDVATIEVEKLSSSQTQVQVVGNTYIYGNDYVVRPTYHYEPLIFGLFWIATYQVFHSHYYWGYYPAYYRPWRPLPAPIYRKNVNIHIDSSNHYNVVNRSERNTNAIKLEQKNSRNDWHSGNRKFSGSENKQSKVVNKSNKPNKVVDSVQKKNHKSVNSNEKLNKNPSDGSKHKLNDVQKVNNNVNKVGDKHNNNIHNSPAHKQIKPNKNFEKPSFNSN